MTKYGSISLRNTGLHEIVKTFGMVRSIGVPEQRASGPTRCAVGFPGRKAGTITEVNVGKSQNV